MCRADREKVINGVLADPGAIPKKRAVDHNNLALSFGPFQRLHHRIGYELRCKPSMDRLTLFGLASVTAMLVFYALERRSPWYIFAFAGACVLASAYGFLQGAWPFGLVEAVWSVIAFRRWRVERRQALPGNHAVARSANHPARSRHK